MVLQRRAPAIVWSWSHAALGLLYAAPAVVMMFIDPLKGLPLAVGVLPAAAAGLPGPRRGRLAICLVGVACGVSMVIGSILALAPIVAVPAIFALAVGAALLAPRGVLGTLVLNLCLPLVGIGLSFDDVSSAAAAAALMALGSVYAWAVSQLWPTSPAQPRRAGPTSVNSLDYGVRLGLAAAIAAAVGFGLDLDHVGWATGATLLVMRPAPEMVRSRGLDRIAGILVGTILASAVILWDPIPLVLAGAILIDLVVLAGTRGSRRYLTPAFTTFEVFLLLLYGNAQDAGYRFLERFTETALGVGLALVFGVLVPALRDRGALAPRQDGGALDD